MQTVCSEDVRALYYSYFQFRVSVFYCIVSFYATVSLSGNLKKYFNYISTQSKNSAWYANISIYHEASTCLIFQFICNCFSIRRQVSVKTTNLCEFINLCRNTFHLPSVLASIDRGVTYYRLRNICCLIITGLSEMIYCKVFTERSCVNCLFFSE